MRHPLLVLPALALLLLAAHFYRAGALLVALGCVALLPLLAVHYAWAVRGLQIALVAGCLEWLWTATLLMQQRLALGQPWLRMALILGAVALFTAAAALVWRHPRLRPASRVSTPVRRATLAH